MNPFLRLIAASLLGLASAALADTPEAAGIEPPHIKRQVLPGYPFDMLRIGEREGDVRLAFSVDEAGKLDDCLAISYTRRSFADGAIAALREWTFEPARYNGRPISSVAQIAMHFEVSGTTVVSLTGSEELDAFLFPMTRRSGRYRFYELKELDRIPTPISVAPPQYPRSLAKAGLRGSVTISFYIDETGAVRLPAAAPGTDPVLASFAIDALSKWRFEPPTCGGHPVLARATQEFRFKPPPDLNREPAAPAEKR